VHSRTGDDSEVHYLAKSSVE